MSAPSAPPAVPRPSASQTMIGLKAFAAAPTISDRTGPGGYIVGTVLIAGGFALVGLVAYGIVLKGVQLATAVAALFVVLGACLVLGGCFALFPDKTKAFMGVLEGAAQDLHLPFFGRRDS